MVIKFHGAGIVDLLDLERYLIAMSDDERHEYELAVLGVRPVRFTDVQQMRWAFVLLAKNEAVQARFNAAILKSK